MEEGEQQTNDAYKKLQDIWEKEEAEKYKKLHLSEFNDPLNLTRWVNNRLDTIEVVSICSVTHWQIFIFYRYIDPKAEELV